MSWLAVSTLFISVIPFRTPLLTILCKN
jgi:hypothetical protein